MNTSRILALGGSICCVLRGSEALGGSFVRDLRGSEARGGSFVRVLRVGEVLGGVGCLTKLKGQVGPLKKDPHGRRGRVGEGVGGSICGVLRGSEALGGSCVRVLRVGEGFGGSDV